MLTSMRHQSTIVLLLVFIIAPFSSVASFAPSYPRATDYRPLLQPGVCHYPTTIRFLALQNDDDKFSMSQRIESIKCVLVGAISGGITVAPVSAIHNLLLESNNIPQWEFDTDMGSLEAALFAIVYRYCIRTDDNDMLKQGVIGAFVLTRTLSKIEVPAYCNAIPLNCGSPIGYFDWNMIQQGISSGLESVALFGAAAYAMDYCFQKGYISKFP